MSLDYLLTIIRLIRLFVAVARDIRAGGTDIDSTVDRTLTAAKSFIPELKELDTAAPEIKLLVRELRDLRNTVEAPK